MGAGSVGKIGGSSIFSIGGVGAPGSGGMPGNGGSRGALVRVLLELDIRRLNLLIRALQGFCPSNYSTILRLKSSLVASLEHRLPQLNMPHLLLS